MQLSQIDLMDGYEFERWLADLFLDAGWGVQWAGRGGGDQGGDLILNDRERRIVVQAKRYNPNNRVGNAAIQEAYTAIPVYQAHEAWVITSGYFTRPAIELARRTRVRLFDRNDLIKWISGEVAIGS